MRIALTPAYAYNRIHSIIGMGLALHAPAVVWSGTISGLPAYPANGTGVGQLSVTTVTGSFANVQSGMTVLINNVYYTYARKAPLVGTLYINSLGEGTVTTSVGTPFAVYKEYLPWPRRHRWDGANWQMNFDEAYTNQNENFGPQAVMGPTAIIYADGNQTFSFDGTRSKAWTPGSAIASYLWTFPDATTSASPTPTWATSTAYPNGTYVDLLITDDNGDTHTGHRLLFKFDSSNRPKTDFESLALRGEWGNGWTAQVVSNDRNMGYSSSYDGNPVRRAVLFGQTAYGTNIVNEGGNFPDRENIWLDGWITEKQKEFPYNSNRYTYTIATVDELLRNQLSFPLALDDDAAPANWLEMKDITLDRVAVHVCKWRSTLLDVVDVTMCENTAASRAKKYFDLESGSLWAQLNQIYSWLVGGIVSVDSQSGIYCEQDAVVAGNVAGLPEIIFLTGDGLTYTRPIIAEGYSSIDRTFYFRPTAKFTAYGIDYATPVGSRSPDDPLSHGAQMDEIPLGLHATQAELNTWAGNRQAQVNRLRTGNTYPTVGIIRIDPTPQSTVSLDSGINYNYIVRACEFEFDLENGMAFSTLELEKAIAVSPAGLSIAFT